MQRVRILLVVGAVASALAVSAGAASVAHASAQGCTSASGGYVCTTVNGSGTYVDSVTAIRGKSGSICRSSAYAYYVPPWGGAYSLGYAARDNCAYGRAWFDFGVRRYLPSGSRVCTKFMELGAPVGGEPCVWIR